MSPAEALLDGFPAAGMAFLTSLHPRERHARGIHYTSAADIHKVIEPTIVRPWRNRIAVATTDAELRQLHGALLRYRILDPACGCGNFLYLAYQELCQLETELLARLGGNGAQSVSVTQLFGIDIDARAAARTKELLQQCDATADLDRNIVCADALFCAWPRVDGIIGNPPFQSKNKMQQEMGVAYLHRLRDRYPNVPGRADYCVYWFRRAHDELPPGGRAGLVGTNTISQNYSREGGLAYIVAHGGSIVEAVASQPWNGDAGVHVSIVNWIKGEQAGPKRLFGSKGDPLKFVLLPVIPSTLAPQWDVSGAAVLDVNRTSGGCFQGQTHGHSGFLLNAEEAADLLRRSPDFREVVFPYLTGDELLDRTETTPWRYVIDFHPRDLDEARSFSELLARIERLVLPTRVEAARNEVIRNQGAGAKRKHNCHHRRFLAKWWWLSYPRPELMAKLRTMKRYIACSRVTTHPIFTFVAGGIHPSDVVQVFPFADDYSFGILQSNLHWEWFKAKCSTLGAGPRYTSETVFDTFPWPESPALSHVQAIAEAGVALRTCREKLRNAKGWNLRQLYQREIRSLRKAHELLDAAVQAAYAMPARSEPLRFLLELNEQLAALENIKRPVAGPGLPPIVGRPAKFVTADCLDIKTTDV
jgi:SAM-dependent methyltransferase